MKFNFKKLKYPTKLSFFLSTLINLFLTFLPTTSEGIKVNGSGATSSKELYRVWSSYFESYRAPFKTVVIKYMPRGSSFGKKQIMENSVIFAGSDIPLSAEESAKYPDLRNFPSSAWFVL